MKKFITLAVAALIAVSATAQVRLGVIGGLTTTQTQVDLQNYSFDPSQVNTYHAGLALNIGLPLGFALQPALVYNVKGTTLDQAIAGQEFQVSNAKYGYLELQGQLQWGIGSGLLRVYGLVEPYVGYGLTNEIDQMDLTSIATGQATKIQDNWDYVNKLEYGLGVGGGIMLLNMVQVSAKWYWNLGKLYNGQSLSTEDALNTAMQGYTNTIQNQQNFSGLVVSAALFF